MSAAGIPDSGPDFEGFTAITDASPESQTRFKTQCDEAVMHILNNFQIPE